MCKSSLAKFITVDDLTFSMSATSTAYSGGYARVINTSFLRIRDCSTHSSINETPGEETVSDLGFSKRGIHLTSSVLHSFVRAHGIMLIRSTCLAGLEKAFDLGGLSAVFKGTSGVWGLL